MNISAPAGDEPRFAFEMVAFSCPIMFAPTCPRKLSWKRWKENFRLTRWRNRSNLTMQVDNGVRHFSCFHRARKHFIVRSWYFSNERRNQKYPFYLLAVKFMFCKCLRPQIRVPRLKSFRHFAAHAAGTHVTAKLGCHCTTRNWNLSKLLAPMKVKVWSPGAGSRLLENVVQSSWASSVNELSGELFSCWIDSSLTISLTSLYYF